MKARRAKRSTAARPSGTADLRARLRQAEQRLRQVKERYEIAMAAIRESVYDWDLKRDEVYYSETMQRELALRPGTLRTTQDWRDRIHPEDQARYRAALIAHFKRDTERFECDYRYRGMDGTWRWARQHGVAVRDKVGRAVRLVGSTGDITQLKRTEEALEHSQGRYDLAMRAINEGVYEWDILKGAAYFSERLYEVLKLTPADFRGPADWRARIHPEDLPLYDAALTAHFKGQCERFECDYRYRAHDGSWRWARQHGLAVRDNKTGRAVRMSGSAGDITDLKQAADALRTSEERYALATAAAVEGIYEWDLQTGRLFLSERAKTFFSLSAEDLTPAAWNVRVHAEDYPRYRAAILDHFKGRTEQVEIEYRIADASGGYKWVLDRGRAVRNAKGRATKMIGALSDITQRKRAEFELRRARDDATEALEQQTATAEILKVISSSLADIQPVLDVVAANAARLCEADDAVIQLRDGDELRFVAHFGDVPLPYRGTRPVIREWVAGRSVIEGRQIHIHDHQKKDTEYPEGSAIARELGFHTMLVTPLMRPGRAIGTILIRRREVKPFSEKQMALVKTFADQAVIAIENVRLFNETKEALERQTATAEILKVIAASPSDVQPVFDAIIKSAARLAGGCSVNVSRLVGDQLHLAAYTPVSPSADEILRNIYPIPVGEVRPLTDAVRKKTAFFVSDFEADPDVSRKARDVMRARGFRSTLYVPMVRGDLVHGVMHVSKVEPGPFPQQWIDLLKTFADQAVIAIENVRLFNETREALDQQTAISEILQVISSSPTDVRPVLSAVAERAARLCEAEFVTILMRENDFLRVTVNSSASGSDRLPDGTELVRIDPAYVSGRAAVTGKTVHVDDVVPLLDTEFSSARDNQRKIGFRTFLAVPLLHNRKAIGVIAAWRRVVRRFSDKQVSLLETFADQAAIAIENVRLFNETKEALDQQTATSEVLKVISQTRIDLQPVLEIVLDNARRLCDADRVLILRPNADGNFVPAAVRISNNASDNVEVLTKGPIRPDRSTAMGRALLERRAVHIPDVRADPDYTRTDLAEAGNFRTALAVPMLREGVPIGAMTLTRAGAPRPFSQKQIDLVTTFADQAVIAIENVRLFNETTEALEQLKASAEILRVISSSVEDTQPVFDAILESCRRLFEGHIVGITTIGEDEAVHLAAYAGPGRQGFEQHFPIPLSGESGSGVAILERRVVHYPDCEAPGVPEYARRGSRFTGTRSVIFAPMLWEERGIGAIFVGRDWSGPFSDKDVALLKTFADQAVIAIQNARLFGEIHEKSRQLEVANRHKSEFLANMSHELRTPLNAIIGFTRIVMRRSREQLEPKQYENLEKIHSSGQHLLALINAILDLSKVEAGHVEVHPAELTLGTVLEQCVRTVEPLVKTPAVRLLKEFDGGLPQVYQDEEKLRQIVINLLSNAAKFTERGTVRVHAKANGDSFAVAVADTGIGIASDKLEHVFEEFAQADASSTRVYGGTGLGLTIARRLARLMGGDIAVQSMPGSGSTFTLTLPVRYEARA